MNIRRVFDGYRTVKICLVFLRSRFRYPIYYQIFFSSFMFSLKEKYVLFFKIKHIVRNDLQLPVWTCEVLCRLFLQGMKFTLALNSVHECQKTSKIQISSGKRYHLHLLNKSLLRICVFRIDKNKHVDTKLKWNSYVQFF